MIPQVQADDLTLSMTIYPEGRSTYVALPTIRDRVRGYLNGSMNGTQNGTASILKEISMVSSFDSGHIGFRLTDFVGKPKL